MRKLATAKRVGAALRAMFSVGAVAALLVASTTVIASVHAQPVSTGPRTWHVLVGGQSADQAIQAEAYYPHVLTIDAGDTVGWTLNTDEIHSVTFVGTCGDIGNVVFHNAAVMRDFPQTVHVRVGDTVVWENASINEISGVAFLAGQALPLLPDWYANGPSGDPTSYDGSSFLDSGPLYAPDAGRNQSFAATFTKEGTFPYVNVGHAFLGVQGTVVVTPAD